ncbi:MAG: ribonuclease E/G [Alphaproteobacteria bacterium]|nr:ribonuclease E/G [Alphaproteobacteria bacterium]
MSRLTMTCDRQNGVIRCAVWQGKTLVDLYVDSIEAPDMTGAVVRGKVVRTASGGLVAWVECGLAQKLYLESKSPVKTGDVMTMKIVSTLGQGKAWTGALTKAEASLSPPPTPWQRALMDLGDSASVTISFADQDDYAAFEASPYGASRSLTAILSLKAPVHPDLDEQMDALLEPVVALGAGPSLVIEPTQALVAIDVNSGDVSSNAVAINLQAVREAARQIRLRNLSGIIVIDCLKMKDRADISKVLNAFARVAESDPCKVHVFGMSKLGLLEVTRTRRGPALADYLRS